jgi:hypothetical protein
MLTTVLLCLLPLFFCSPSWCWAPPPTLPLPLLQDPASDAHHSAALLAAFLFLQPIMVLGSAASTAGLLWFGLAGSYTSAAASRAVAGLLNGIIV